MSEALEKQVEEIAARRTRLMNELRAALATYDAAPGSKYDHPTCACTWCAFVRAVRETVAE